MKWYVCIDHLDDNQLEFFGFSKYHENEEFEIYGSPYGDDGQVIEKGGKRFLFVEDWNDAQQMKSAFTIGAPKPTLI